MLAGEPARLVVPGSVAADSGAQGAAVVPGIDAEIEPRWLCLVMLLLVLEPWLLALSHLASREGRVV